MTTDLEILRADLAAARLSRPRARLAVLTIAAAATLTAAAYAASHYLGQPASAHVRATFARYGAWMPADPIDVSKAEVVALSKHTVLYGAPTKTGGYCLELLGHGGFVYQLFCDRSRAPTGLLLYTAGLANHGTASAPPPVAISGRMSIRGKRLEMRTPGHVQRVAAGLHGFFSFEPADQEGARHGRAVLVELDARGEPTSRVHVPAQIVLDTVGNPARRIDGIVFDPRARRIFFELWASLRLGHSQVDQTGIGTSIEIGADGRFSFTAPQPPHGKTWFYSMAIVDRRFVLLPSTDTTWVPDASFWSHARAEAERNGV